MASVKRRQILTAKKGFLVLQQTKNKEQMIALQFELDMFDKHYKQTIMGFKQKLQELQITENYLSVLLEEIDIELVGEKRNK